jgi:1-acyl-sn-glycerol-3-phosphate acyltransferase
MKKVLDYTLGSLYLLYFGTILVIFHGIQFIAYTFFGQAAHQKTVIALNFCIVKGWLLTGSRSTATSLVELPTNQTIIFIANHQSMFDIPGIIWYFRKYCPLFISKKELAKGIPSISYNLRVGKAALIDRKDPKQAIAEIIRFSEYINRNNFSAVIFPEGTRSRTGQLKPFAVGGVATLLKKCKNAMVVPIAIQGTGRFNPKSVFPLTSFSKLTWHTLQPIDRKEKTPEEIVKEAENQIRTFLKQNLH